MQTLLIFEDCGAPLSTLLGPGPSRVIEVDGRVLAQDSDAAVLRVHDLVPYNRLYQLNQRAKEIAASWYMVGDEDVTWSRELQISIGDCLRLPLSQRLARCFRYAALLTVLAEESDGDEILVWGTAPANGGNLLSGRDLHAILDHLAAPWRLAGPQHWATRHGSAMRSLGLRGVMDHVEDTMRLGLFALRYASVTAQRAFTGRRSGPDPVIADEPARPGSAAEHRPRILSAPDTVLGGFIEKLSDHLHTDLVLPAPVRPDWRVRYEAFRDFRARLSRIEGSAELERLCGADSLWLLPIIKRWLAQRLPSTAAYLVDEGSHFVDLLARGDTAALFLPMAWAGRPRMHLAVARSRGVPTFVVQDGVLATHETTPGNEVVPDFAVVLGPSGRHWFEEGGVPPDNILVAGEHVWGRAPQPVGPGRASAGRARVLYCAPRPPAHGAQYSLFEAEEEIELVCKAVASFPELTLRVRVHPRTVVESPGAEWRRRIEQMILDLLGDRAAMSDERQPYAAALAEADLVVCYPSTTLVQAAHAGKDTIMVDFSGRRTALVSGVPAAFSLAELVSRLGEYTRGKSMEGGSRAILAEHLSQSVDCARFVDRVNGLIHRSTPGCESALRSRARSHSAGQ